MHTKTAHTAIGHALSTIDRRLARWLLMAHDRMGDDTLLLTHDFRRPGATEALNTLRKQGLI
jgi:hypothetical protein